MIYSFIQIAARKRFCFICYVLISFSFVHCSTSSDLASEDVTGAISNSNFIFSGVVLHNDSSNIDSYIPRRMAIVRVDSVYDAREPFYSIKGKEVTVLFRDPSIVHTEGSQMTFFTSGWYYGKTLGFVEVDSRINPVTDLKNKIRSTRQSVNDNALSERLKETELVVAGKVLEVRTDTLKIPFIRSEHNPELKIALIEVRSSIKGSNVKTVWVYFASSMDVMWRNSPKLSKNLEGIFLLERGDDNTFFNKKEYSLLGNLQIQPLREAERIKKLLKK